MKSLKLQIEFVDKKLLGLFGFKNIIDYSHIICVSDPDTIPIDLDKLNELIEEFRKIFHAKNFSLHKTQYKIITKSQAVCLLKTCLEITSIPYDLSTKKHKRYLRLLSKNNILEDYINTLKMTENRTLTQKDFYQYENNVDSLEFTTSYQHNERTQSIKSIPISAINFDKKNPQVEIKTDPPTPKTIVSPWNNFNMENQQMEIKAEPPKPKAVVGPWHNATIEPDTIGHKETEKIQIITKEELNENIKKITNFEYYLLPKKLLQSDNIKIDIKECGLMNKSLKSFCIKFVSKKIEGESIISDHFIKQINSNLKYELVIGGDVIYADKFVNGQNCLIDNIILILRNLQYHPCFIYIKNISHMTNILDVLELQISGEYVEFYQDIEKKISSGQIEQTICHNNKYNLLKIMCGMAGLAYTNFLELKRFNELNLAKNFNEKCQIDMVLKPAKDIVNESDLFVGKQVYLDLTDKLKITGFEITKLMENFKDDQIIKVFEYRDYKYVCWIKCLTKLNNFIKYYRIVDEKNIHTHYYDIYFDDYEIPDNFCRYTIFSKLCVIEKMEMYIGDISNPNNVLNLNVEYIFRSDNICINIPCVYTISNQIIKFDFDSKCLMMVDYQIYGIRIKIQSKNSDVPLHNDISIVAKMYKLLPENENKLFKYNSCLIDIKKLFLC